MALPQSSSDSGTSKFLAKLAEHRAAKKAAEEAEAEWDKQVAEWVQLTLGDLDNSDRPWTTQRYATYYEKAVEAMLVEMARAPGGARNVTLNAIAYRLGRLTAGMGMEAYGLRALELLQRAARRTRLPEREIKAASLSGFRMGLANPWTPA